MLHYTLEPAPIMVTANVDSYAITVSWQVRVYKIHTYVQGYLRM